MRPKFQEGNKIHDYCGKTCAAKAKAGGAGNATVKIDLCIVRARLFSLFSLLFIEPLASYFMWVQVCGQRPKFKEGNTTYDYCGKTCAGKAKSKGGVNVNVNVNVGVQADLCIVSAR